jgi:hypothetical protein
MWEQIVRKYVMMTALAETEMRIVSTASILQAHLVLRRDPITGPASALAGFQGAGLEAVHRPPISFQHISARRYMCVTCLFAFHYFFLSEGWEELCT